MNDFKILDAKSVQSAPEILIYFWIKTLVDFIDCMNQARSLASAEDPVHGQSVTDDIENANSDQELLVDMLKSRKEFAFTNYDEFKRWYRWWNHWHNSQLSSDQWKLLKKILKWDETQTEETFVDWRPSGDWRTSVATNGVDKPKETK